ncbi:MAG TPA: ABC transporter permease [Vicinamibacterales bacterium]|nr:ABC transporter permease [Vicinamibacterales bacterium]
MSSALHDARFALRLLWKDKAFSVATLLTLAVCIGANTVLFSIVYSVLLKPLPVPDSGRLLLLYNSYPRAGAERGSSGAPDYFDRVKGVTALESLSLFNTRSRSAGENGRPERVLSMSATPSFFRVAGVKALLGRTFTDDEGEIGHDDKVVLSHAFWRERFGGDRSAVGRQLRLDGTLFTIVGVMPEEFRFINADVRLWTPLAFTPDQRSDNARHSNNWTSIGRLKPGATIGQVQAQVDAINAASLEQFPAFKQILVNAGFHTVVVPLQDDLVRNVKGTLYLLWGGTLFVLLIGCVNVINLALVRARVRAREIATRLALGAGRWQLARQLVTESLIVTVASGVLGLFLGWAALRVLGTLNLDQIPRGGEIRLDAVAVAFTMGVAALLGVVIGAFPFASALHVDMISVFHEGGRTRAGGRGASLLRRSLVVTQVAVAFMLMIGAGLLMASFRQVAAVDPGFDPRNVLTATVTLPASRYAGDDELRTFAADAVRRIGALPGVAQAGATSNIPFGGNHSDSVILAEGYQMMPGESLISPWRLRVTPGYFEAMGIPLKRGRLFDGRDARDAPRVVIVDERLARKFWPARDPIGRRMYRPGDVADPLATNERTEWFTVVGVVGEIKQHGLVESRTSVGAYYFPVEQGGIRTMTFTMRTTTVPGALANEVRQAVASLDPELPVFLAKTMEEWIGESLVTRRWPMLLSMGFGVVALLLSAVGIYGVLAYLVTQRTKEIGIRMALGGTPRSVFDLVLKEGLVLVGAGLVVGAIGVVAIRRGLEAQLYGVRLSDPGVLAIAVLFLGAAAVTACVIPARRATRIDPVAALSQE